MAVRLGNNEWNAGEDLTSSDLNDTFSNAGMWTKWISYDSAETKSGSVSSGQSVDFKTKSINLSDANYQLVIRLDVRKVDGSTTGYPRLVILVDGNSVFDEFVLNTSYQYTNKKVVIIDTSEITNDPFNVVFRCVNPDSDSSHEIAIKSIEYIGVWKYR